MTIVGDRFFSLSSSSPVSRGVVRVDAKNTTISTIRLERWVDFASRFQNLYLLCRAVLRRREEPIHATPNTEQRVVSNRSGALRSVNQRSAARCLDFPLFSKVEDASGGGCGGALGSGQRGHHHFLVGALGRYLVPASPNSVLCLNRTSFTTAARSVSPRTGRSHSASS